MERKTILYTVDFLIKGEIVNHGNILKTPKEAHTYGKVFKASTEGCESFIIRPYNAA